MSENARMLADRKRMLIARSRLHRLEMQHGMQQLRQSMARPKTVFAFASSAPVRPLIFSALTYALGRGRFGKLLRGAMAALAVAKVVGAVIGRPRGGAEG
jgi:hypothetical protein